MGIITDMGRKFINKFIGGDSSPPVVEASDSQDKYKKPKIRGKALTRNQMKTLIENGLDKDEVELYLLHKTSFVQEGAEKRLNQSCNKVEVWTLVHRATGELRGVYIK